MANWSEKKRLKKEVTLTFFIFDGSLHAVNLRANLKRIPNVAEVKQTEIEIYSRRF